MTNYASQRDKGRRIEFLLLFVGVPLALSFLAPADAIFPALFALTLLGAVLLARTPGFSWGEIARGWLRIRWRFVAGIALLTALVTLPAAWLLRPAQFLLLPREMPGLWLAILMLYPVLSALPQELLFRPLFFRRYAVLFPGRTVAILANAALFALAHLAFWNWPAVVMTFAGSLMFAAAYLRGGFATAVAAHGAAGGVVFTSGLGTYFYHGAIPA